MHIATFDVTAASFKNYTHLKLLFIFEYSMLLMQRGPKVTTHHEEL
jgi:hypothetical protein